MQTQITSSSSHLERQLGKEISHGFFYELKLAVFTACFAIFAICIVLGAWYVSQWFQNESYKAVVFFLDLITISNLTSKYTIWTMKQ